MLSIYTDGACQPNPGECGSAFAVFLNDSIEIIGYGGYIEHSTNNVGELNALLKALQYILKEYSPQYGNKIIFYIDSVYVLNAVTIWYKNWMKKEWKNSKGKEVANKNIIKAILAQIAEIKFRHKIKLEFNHVKGHSGVYGNEVADQYAVLAIKEKRGSYKFVQNVD